MKKLLLTILIIFSLGLSLVHNVNAGFFDTIKNYFFPQQKLSAVAVNYTPDLQPLIDSKYYIGTTTKAYKGIITDELCLTGDTCYSSISLGSGATVFGELNDVATSSDATGDVYYLNSSGQLTNLGIGSAGEVLEVSAGGIPEWDTDDTGAGGGGSVGTSTTPTIGQLPYWTTSGANTELLGSTATTSLTASSPLSLSQPISVIGASASAISLDTSGTWSGNAGTATALASNGANCSAGNTPLGVDTAGAVESCFDVWTESENTSAGYISTSDLWTDNGSYLTAQGNEWIDVDHIVATSTIATSTFAGDVVVLGGLVVDGEGTEKNKITVQGADYDSPFMVQDIGTNYSATANIHKHSTTAPPILAFSRSNTDDTSHAIMTDGQLLGAQYYLGHDGTDYNIAALLSVGVDGTPGANDMPGRFMFSTSPDGSNTPVERLRIDNAGNVGIGTTSPYAKLSVIGETVASHFTATTTATSTFPNISATQLLISDDYITDFAGTGLSVSAGTLNAEVQTSDLHDAVTLAGTPNYLTLAGQEITLTVLDVSDDTNLSVSATGIELSGDAIALSADYEIPLTASTTNWNNFYDTPSSVITAGTGLSWATNTLNLDNDFGSDIGVAELASADFGDWTCNGSACTLDIGVVDATALATNSVGSDELSSSAIQAGDYPAGGIDGDDVNSNIAGRSLTLTAGSPDTLDVDSELYTESASANLIATSSNQLATSTTPWLSKFFHQDATLTGIYCTAYDTGTSTIKVQVDGTDVLYGSGLNCGADVSTASTTLATTAITSGQRITVFVQDAEPTGSRPRLIEITPVWEWSD